MDYEALEEIAEHLNEFGEGRFDDIQPAAMDLSAGVARRIAAVLYLVAASDHPANTAANDLIVKITAGEKEEAHPLDTPIGQLIVKAVKLQTDELVEIQQNEKAGAGSRTAAQFVLAADAGVPYDNPAWDHILRHTTGRNVAWWLGWIRKQRKGFENPPKA